MGVKTLPLQPSRATPYSRPMPLTCPTLGINQEIATIHRL
jgi:hypothetical protein